MSLPKSPKPPAIKVHNLYRYFGQLKAVNGISFEIPHGSVCGFVGANGAGKTTTMRILASLDYPTMGVAEICGINVVHHPEEVRRMIGWMPDHFGNYEHMTVLEYLDFYARAFGYKGKERKTRVQEVMEFTDLVPLAERFSNKLSKGMTQRLCLGRALLHDPQVLIMDTPAAGLDPKARVELKHLIRVLAQEGKTIFISSHILSELGEMCDSLLFVNGGRIVHHGDAETLKQGTDAHGGMLYDIQVIGDPQAVADWCVVNPHVEFLESRKAGGRIRIEADDPARAADVLQRMIKDGLKVVEFHKEQRNLEDAFIDMLGRIDRGEGALPTVAKPQVPAFTPSEKPELSMSTVAAAAPAAPPLMDSHAAGRFDDFSDSLSPMLVKELRQGLRAKTFVIVFLGLQALLALVLLTAVAAASPENAGQRVSETIFFFFSLAVLVVQPLRGVGALHNEIKGNTIDLMVLTRLGAWRIVLGKWVAIVSQSALLLTAIAPYLILRYFFGGMNLFAELLLLALVFIGSGIFTAFTVGLSAIGPILIRGLVPLGIGMGITIGIFNIIFGNDLHEFIEFCTLQRTGSGWGLLATVLTGTYIGWTSLAFGTSQIAPMAENHSTPRRLVAIGTVVLFGLIAWAGDFRRDSVMGLLTVYCVPAIAFALTEPMQLLPPICRPFLKYGGAGKIAGRFLYPGWPAGVIFTALLLLIGAGVYFWVPERSPMVASYREMSQDITMLMIIGTLLLPALVLRIFSKKVKQNFAFYLLIAVILGAVTLGLGMIADVTMRDDTIDDGYLWLFCWIPPVKMLLMDLIRHEYRGSYGGGIPSAGPDYTPVLLIGLVTTGTYLFLLLLCAVRQFPLLREVEEEAEGRSPPNSREADSAEPTTP